MSKCPNIYCFFECKGDCGNPTFDTLGDHPETLCEKSKLYIEANCPTEEEYEASQHKHIKDLTRRHSDESHDD